MGAKPATNGHRPNTYSHDASSRAWAPASGRASSEHDTSTNKQYCCSWQTPLYSGNPKSTHIAKRASPVLPFIASPHTCVPTLNCSPIRLRLSTKKSGLILGGPTPAAVVWTFSSKSARTRERGGNVEKGQGGGEEGGTNTKSSYSP